MNNLALISGQAYTDIITAICFFCKPEYYNPQPERWNITMSEMNNNNQNTQLDPETQNSENVSEQSENGQQYYGSPQYNEYSQYDNPQQGYPNQPYANGQQYYNGPDYNNGQYYGSPQYYNNGQPGYNGGQNYNNGQPGYNGGQNYNNGQPGYNGGQNYNNGQPDYNGQQYFNNGQYYGQNADGNNQQYYGQNTGYNNQQYYGPNTGYNNGQYYGYGQQPYTNPQAAFRPAEPVREPVTNLFYYILMALSAVSAIIGIIAAKSLISNMFSSIDFNSVAGQDFATMYSSMMYSFSNAPGYAAYSVLSSVLGFAILVISIIDIVCVHKKGYPILGLILFTILCKPGYFIWRAYVLKQKKTIPILYTVTYVLLYIVYFIWSFSYILSLMA